MLQGRKLAAKSSPCSQVAPRAPAPALATLASGRPLGMHKKLKSLLEQHAGRQGIISSQDALPATRPCWPPSAPFAPSHPPRSRMPAHTAMSAPAHHAVAGPRIYITTHTGPAGTAPGPTGPDREAARCTPLPPPPRLRAQLSALTPPELRSCRRRLPRCNKPPKDPRGAPHRVRLV